MNRRRWSAALGICVLLGCGDTTTPEPPADGDCAAISAAASRVLQASCASSACHDRAEPAAGVDVQDVEALIRRGLIAPGDSARSKLMAVVRHDAQPYMPLGAAQLPDEDIQTLARWIDGRCTEPPVAALSTDALEAGLCADLEGQPPERRRFVRYVVMSEVNNRGGSADEITRLRRAVEKMLNSVFPQQGKLVRVREVPGTSGSAFAIDLRAFGLGAAGWSTITTHYPFSGLRGSAAAACLVPNSGDPNPYVRASWLVAELNRAPVYHALLDVPDTLAGLELKLGVDSATGGLPICVALPSGKSEVAFKNRILCWQAMSTFVTGYEGSVYITHDCTRDEGACNVFQHPLDFRAEGHEVIWTLPNGLFGWALYDGSGDRIEVAPIELVRDSAATPPQVKNPTGCFSCHHTDGIRIASNVLKPDAFPQPLDDAVRAVFRPEDDFNSVAEASRERFHRALTELAIDLTPGREREPISTSVQAYEASLTFSAFAAELGYASGEELRAHCHFDTLRRSEPVVGLLADTVEPLMSRADFLRKLDGMVQVLSRPCE